ncbi:MAG: cytochrome c biogenesis protein CcsA, partial [Ignavibacteriaceae bacterium]|nr:cytochrome c biogenesis protein CcsA [Ignavibacteriaceae bacterium]
IALLFQVLSSIFIRDLTEVKDVLRSNLLGVHVFHALLGYAGITISAVYGFLYLTLYKEIKTNKFGLIFDRLPNLEILERLSFSSAVIGFIALSIATTIGLIWLPQAFPDFSYADPKLIVTFIVWLMYGVGIILKTTGQWRGKKVVVLSIAGFLLAIFSTIVTNYISRSFHSFY